MWMVIIYFPVDIKNFEISLSFFIESFFQDDKKIQAKI